MPATITDRLYGENSSVAVKAPVRTVSVGANLALSGLQPVGGVALNEGDRVLVKDQTDPTQNGIYNASASGWQRSGDFDGAYDVVQGTLVIVLLGNGQGLLFQVSSPNPITIGTSPITFTPYTNPNLIYSQTLAEALAGVVPVNYADEPLPIIDARRFGWAEANTETQNATALVLAIQVLQNNGVYGGTIQLPPGIFDCDPFNIPAFVNIRGVGGNGTRLRNGDAGYFIKIGGDKSGALKYKCGISSVSVILFHKDGNAIRLMETTGAHVKDIYSEGTLTAGRSNQFLTIDGGDASNFFNHIQDCIANHYEGGYRMITTGTTACTQTEFTNCNSLGDVHGVGAASIGLDVAAGCGNGSLWKGGNFEACGIGIRTRSNCGAHGIVIGARFEDNTIDVQFDSFSNPWTFFGCTMMNPAKIVNNSGTGYDSQQFIGCTDSTGIPLTGRFMGRQRFNALKTGDVPIRITSYPGETDAVNAFQTEESSGTVYFSIDAYGAINKLNQRPLKLVSTSGSPEGNITAPAGSFAFDVSGQSWVKNSGSGNTGWKQNTHA